MNYFKLYRWTLPMVVILAMVACSESTPSPKDDTQDDTEDPVETPSMMDMITTTWRIDSAYHKGANDISSTGKRITFYSNYSYDFNGSLTGTWYFNTDSTKVVIDEGKSYRQDWTIVELSEDRFEADFKSPFTGGASTWIMHPKP